MQNNKTPNNELPTKTTLTFSHKQGYDKNEVLKFIINSKFVGYEVSDDNFTKMQPSLLIFINEEIADINSSDPELDNNPHRQAFPDFACGKDLVKYADFLLQYRIMLQNAYESESYNNNYIEFVNTNPVVNEGLEKNNPFIICEYLTKIYNKISDINQMLRYEIPQNATLINQFSQYHNMLLQMGEKIATLSIKEYGPYRHYLEGFMHNALANCYFIRANSEYYDLQQAKFYVEQAYMSALRGEGMEKFNTNFIDFLTLKRGLLSPDARVFTRFKEDLEKLDILSYKEIDNCIKSYHAERSVEQTKSS